MENQNKLAVVPANTSLVVANHEGEKRNRVSARPMSRKAFFADAAISAQFKGNYFDYMKSNESVGAIASEEARAAGLVFTGWNRSTDKVTGELLATSIRWSKAPKAKQDDEIAKLRVELNAALVELKKLRK